MDYLKKVDRSLLSIIKKIGKEADRQEKCIYLVGGIVRDLILGNSNFDADLVLEGDACQFANSMASILNATVKIYPKFGTATLKLKNGQGIDITSARSENYAYPGALPLVQKGKSLKEDLLRRDFTINALAIAINAQQFGVLIDPYNGMADLQHKKIRVLHDQSFEDDPTRILRGIRFEQRLGYKFDQRTLKLLKEAMAKSYDQTVSKTRYFAEFKKLLKEENPIQGLKRLEKLQGLSFLELQEPLNYRLLKKIERELIQRKSRQKQDFSIESWLLYFLGVTISLPKQKRHKLSGDVQLSKDAKRVWIEAADYENLLRNIKAAKTPSEVFQCFQRITILTVLFLKVLAKGSDFQKINRYFEQDQFIQLKINGDDIKKSGVSSGKKIGKILESVLLKKIDQGFQTKKQELQFVKEIT